MEQLSVGLLYLSLHNNLIKGFGINKKINRKEFLTKISRHFLLPKNLRPIIIKEMEERGLIKKVDRDHIIVLKQNINIEKDVVKIYRLAGIY